MNVMIKTIKELHTNDICLFKVGSFYHCYDRDTYILSYIFNYKIKELEKGQKECGFPTKAINKVIAKLEQNEISYVLIDKRNDYEVDEQCDFKNLNRYNEFYEKARNYLNYKNRINSITKYLLENINKKDFRKLLGKMEDIIINERRKI